MHKYYSRMSDYLHQSPAVESVTSIDEFIRIHIYESTHILHKYVTVYSYLHNITKHNTNRV